jgi:NAD(P)-dependent dehydrogenase (short-subunit alcohol dehydrogenase family)
MKTALITGASRGLGRALARQLAKQGWGLVIDARNPAELDQARLELTNINTAPSDLVKVIAMAGDVTDEMHRTDLANAALQLGGLDAVVNNASYLGPSPQPALLDYPADVLRKVYETNVIAPLALLQELRGLLRAGGRVLNITSDAGVEAYAGWGGYGSSKAALEHLSAILAEENPSLRVYWVDPGDMRTQMQQEAFPNEDIGDRPLPEDSVPGLIELIEGEQPSGRYKAREIAPQRGD